MKKSEALKHLNNMLLAIQKYRSNSYEMLDGYNPKTIDSTLSDINKWIFNDEYCPLPLLMKIVDSGQFTPMDFYNMMTILHLFMPEIVAVSKLLIGEEFPKQDISIVGRGWDEE